MGRAIKGRVEWRGGRWKVQATGPDGSRDWRDLPATIRPDEKERAEAIGAVYAKKLRAGEFISSDRDETVSEWMRRWFDWRKGLGWPDADKLWGQYKKHVEPILGHLAMRAVVRDDIKRVVGKLDGLVKAETMAWKTATNLWSQVVSKPFKDATNGKNPALCVLERNPAEGVAPPDKGARTRKQYLYPNEAMQLLSCEAVPLWRRRLYAFAIYTYMRAGEIAALRCDDVDVDHGIITVHQAVNRDKPAEKRKVKATKTDRERRFPIEPALRPLLEVLLEEVDGPVLFPKLPPYNGHDGMAATLRVDLERAGCRRAALLVKARTRKRMTFHDLRATGMTWAAVRGDDALKIMARSGHDTYETMRAYVREAEIVRDGFGEVFFALPETLLTRNSDEAEKANNWPKGQKSIKKPDKKASPRGFESPAKVNENQPNPAKSGVIDPIEKAKRGASRGQYDELREAILEAVVEGKYARARVLLDLMENKNPGPA